MSATTNLGKVSVTPKGAWAITNAYEILDIVTSGGSSYLAKQDVPTGVPLTNTSYWIMIAEKGDGGEVTSASASISGGYGTPGVTVTAGGTAHERTLAFAFTNLRGEKGETGNGIDSVYKTGTSGLVDTYTILFTDGSTYEFEVNNGTASIDNTLTKSGWAADAKVVGDTKASIDGSYETLTAGNAEQLVSSVGINDKVPYNFRTTGGSADVGNRKTEKIIGGTIAWNQNAKALNSTNWSTSGTTTTFADGVATVLANGQYQGIECAAVIPVGHKVLLSAKVKTTTATNQIQLLMQFGQGTAASVYTVATTNWQTVHRVATIENGVTINVRIRDNRASDRDTFDVKEIQCFDLTLMFGSAIADYLYTLETATPGAGVAKFRQLFPKPYYAYNAGELMSVKTSKNVMTGFNQFDKSTSSAWVNIYPSSGTVSLNTSCVSAIIKCLPNTKYFIHKTLGERLNVASFTNIPQYGDSYSLNPTIITQGKSQYFTTGANDRYLLVWFYNANIDTGLTAQQVADTLCVNISWDGERDGEYESYETHEYPLDSDLELRGIWKLDSNNDIYCDGDEYESDGTVTRRFGTGTFTTQWNTAGTNLFSRGVMSSPKKPESNSDVANFSCNKYSTVSKSNIVSTDKAIAFGSDGYLYVHDSSYSTVEAFAADSGNLVFNFELATPTTETASPYTNPMIVDDFGTEEFVDSREVAIPVGHDTFYQANLKAKLEMAPNSPDGDGDYIVRQTNGTNEYTDIANNSTIAGLVSRVPDAPSEDGTYTLKATVSNGTKTYSWVADE